jgi:hypothetical protein
MRIVVGIVLALALMGGTASAGVPEQSPSAGPIIVQRGGPFGIGSVYLATPVWLPDDAPEIRALGITSAPGRGSIVIHAILADTRSYYHWSGPQIRALVTGDEAALPRESSSWYIATWDRAIRPFLIKGENAVYVVHNVAEPTAAHPLKAVLFAGTCGLVSYACAPPYLDPGYADVANGAPFATPIDPPAVAAPAPASAGPGSTRRPL